MDQTEGVAGRWPGTRVARAHHKIHCTETQIIAASGTNGGMNPKIMRNTAAHRG